MLERLLKIGKSVLGEEEVGGVLAMALDGLIKLCGAERGMILLFGPDGGVIFEEARNLRKEDIERPEFEVSRGLIDKVRAEGEAFWHRNVLDDPLLGERASVRRLAILSVMCLPIRRRDEVFGVVYLDNRSAMGLFGEETAEVVESFADFISLAAHNALERQRLTGEVNALSQRLRERYDFDAILGHDARMVEVLQLVSRIADSQATVLVQGESGTGKELIARALHHNSRRRERPFVAVNCGALPAELIEAELFGHVRGAFTGAVNDHPGFFERARGGTLFLDEIGELRADLQVRLLRVLESGEYHRVGDRTLRRADARVVAATNRNPQELVAEGRMRRDLLFRLNAVEIVLPPLRERRSDIPVLVRHFLDTFGRKAGATKRLSRAAERRLLAYDYPGNVRELKNAVERAFMVAEGKEIQPGDLPESFRPQEESPGAAAADLPADFKEAKRRVVEEFERAFLSRHLEVSRGKISQAARAARLDYKNFYTKMRRYGIDPKAFKPGAGRQAGRGSGRGT